MKKLLSVALASLTILGITPVRAEGGPQPNEKVNTSKSKFCKSNLALAAITLSPLIFCAICEAYENLHAVTVGTPGRNLTKEDLKIYSKKCKVKGSGVIPTFMGIGGEEFEVDLVSARKIKICDGVTGIEDGTFKDCSKAQKIIIPNSVAYIGNHAFLSYHFHFNPKVYYNGKNYNSTRDFLKEFKENHR